MAEKMKVEAAELMVCLNLVSEEIRLLTSSRQYGGFSRFSEGSLLIYDPGYFVAVDVPNLGLRNSSVPVQKLFEVLNRFGEEEIEVWTTEKELRIQKPGGRKKCGLIMEQDPFPEEMKTLPKANPVFGLDDKTYTALTMCCEIAHQARRADYACVHMGSKHASATDNFRILRAPSVCPTAGKQSILVPPEPLLRSIKRKPKDMGVVQDQWLVLRGDSPVKWVAGVRLIQNEDYPDLSKPLKEEGTPVSLPARTSDILDRTGVFSQEGARQIRIRISKGEIIFRSEGEEGWFEEKGKIRYESKEDVEFCLDPVTLREVVALQGTQAILCKNSIRFEAENGTVLAAALIAE